MFNVIDVASINDSDSVIRTRTFVLFNYSYNYSENAAILFNDCR